MPTSTLSIPSVADLSFYNQTTCEIIFVEDIRRTSGNPFVYKSSGSANDGTIYNAAGSGVWMMMFDGPINVKWFGADGGGVNDTTLEI